MMPPIMLITTSHLLSLPDSDSAVPEWILLLPTGAALPRDGRGPWQVDPGVVVAATLARQGTTDLAIDYEHQSVHAKTNGQPAPAAGWISQLEARPDGVWGRTSWTERAKGHLAAREYRYLSPAFQVDPRNRAQHLVSVALVTSPALELPALASQSCFLESSMPLAPVLAATLGLPSATPEDALIARVRDLNEGHVALCAALAVPTATPTAGLVLAAQAGLSPDPAKFAPLAALEAANAELAKLKQAGQLAEAEALVLAASADGKLPPAMLTWGREYAASNPVGFKAWAAAAPKIVLAGQAFGAGTPPVPGASLDAEESRVCAAMGLTPEAFLKAKGEK